MDGSKSHVFDYKYTEGGVGRSIEFVPESRHGSDNGCIRLGLFNEKGLRIAEETRDGRDIHDFIQMRKHQMGLQHTIVIRDTYAEMTRDAERDQGETEELKAERPRP